MKKEYRKPYLMVESFQLDAAIASGCSEKDGKQPLNHSLEVCTLVEEAPTLGVFANSNCNHNIIIDGSYYDYICYHGPIPYTTMFMDS